MGHIILKDTDSETLIPFITKGSIFNDNSWPATIALRKALADYTNSGITIKIIEPIRQRSDYIDIRFTDSNHIQVSRQVTVKRINHYSNDDCTVTVDYPTLKAKLDEILAIKHKDTEIKYQQKEVAALQEKNRCEKVKNMSNLITTELTRWEAITEYAEYPNRWHLNGVSIELDYYGNISIYNATIDIIRKIK